MASVFSAADARVLYNSALADFAHDFSDPGRSDVTLNTLNGVPIEYSKAPGRNYAALTAMITAAQAAAVAAGKHTAVTPAQAYWIFRESFGTTVPATAGVPAVNAPPSEPDVLALANINYDAIMAQLTRENADAKAREVASGRSPAPLLYSPAAPEVLGFTTRHNYQVHSLPAKYGNVVYDIPTLLNRLLGTGQTTFVLMWDAGNISITNLHVALAGATGGPYTFYFIRSKENISDPAPKITASSMESSANVNVYFLEDNLDHVSTYPIYVDGSTNNENLFSNFTLETKLNEGGATVSGTIKVGTTSMSVKDIGRQSEVKQAVITAVHMKLNGERDAAIMPYFFLKRAGDWCQALCLLDRDRKYEVFATKGAREPVTSQISISDLESKGAYVAMITVDRIMLSYVIGAGLNAFYTTVRSGATWVTSFQNTDSGKTDDVNNLKAEFRSLKARASAINKIYNDTYDSVFAQLTVLDGIRGGFGPRNVDFVDRIIELRKNYLHLASLPEPTRVNETVGFAESAYNLIVADRFPDGPTRTREFAREVARLRNAIASIAAMETAAAAPMPTALIGKEAKSEEAFRAVVAKIRGQQQVDRQDAGIIAYYSFIDDISEAVKKLAVLPEPTDFELTPPKLTFVKNGADPVFPATRSQPAGITAGDLLVGRWNSEFIKAGGGKPMKGGDRILTHTDDLYQIHAYEPTNAEDVAVAGLLSLSGTATAAIGSSIILPSGFFATVCGEYLFEPGSETVIGKFKGPLKTAYSEILKLDKLRMILHKLQSAHALDSVAQSRLFDIHTGLNSADRTYRNADAYIEPLYPKVDDCVDSDSYERSATSAFLIRVLEMEAAIRQKVERHLSGIRKFYKDSAAADYRRLYANDRAAVARANAVFNAADTKYVDMDVSDVIESGIRGELDRLQAAVTLATVKTGAEPEPQPSACTISGGGRRPLFGGAHAPVRAETPKHTQ